MTFVDENPELAVAVAAIVASGLGYWLRTQFERRDTLREAQFHLLGIWNRAVIVDTNHEAAIDRLTAGLHARLAPHGVSEADIAAWHPYMGWLLGQMQIRALAEAHGLVESYEKVIRMIAKSDPILAHDLASSTLVRGQLSLLDEMLHMAYQPFAEQGPEAAQASAYIQAKIGESAAKDATRELERHLRRLARRCGVSVWLRTSMRIHKRAKRNQEGPSHEELQTFFDEVLSPLLEASNTSVQPTASGGG